MRGPIALFCVVALHGVAAPLLLLRSAAACVACSQLATTPQRYQPTPRQLGLTR